MKNIIKVLLDDKNEVECFTFIFKIVSYFYLSSRSKPVIYEISFLILIN